MNNTEGQDPHPEVDSQNKMNSRAFGEIFFDSECFVWLFLLILLIICLCIRISDFVCLWCVYVCTYAFLTLICLLACLFSKEKVGTELDWWGGREDLGKDTGGAP